MKEIKLNDKVVKTIQVNKNKRVVTVVSDDMMARSRNAIAKLINIMRMEEGKPPFNTEPIEAKVITQSQPNANDEFDPYIGVALALAYNLFGSKTQFRKYVKEEILKEKEEVKKASNEEDEITKQDLYKNTLEDLRCIANKRGLKGYSRLTKSALVDLLYEDIITWNEKRKLAKL